QRQQPRALPQRGHRCASGARQARNEPRRAPAHLRRSPAHPRARPALHSALVVAQRRRHAADAARLRALPRRQSDFFEKGQFRAASGMRRFLLRRVLLLLPTLLGAVTLVFILIHVVPGDPVEAMLGETASSADKAALARELGLDQPLLTQYVQFLAGL